MLIAGNFRILYAANEDSVKEIMHCTSARSDSLKLSPSREYVALSSGKDLHVVRGEFLLSSKGMFRIITGIKSRQQNFGFLKVI